MLKSYNELFKIDVMPYCETKEVKDDKNNKKEIYYLNWAKCKQILHENGASSVFYEPLQAEDGSFLFKTNESYTDNYEKQNECYFVKVRITIDDLVFDMATPLLNGTAVVNKSTLNQLRIGNAHARAFVKGVAIRTGLGFSLWLKENEEDFAIRTLEEEDLTKHNIFAIKKRLEQLLTDKIKSGKTKEQVLKCLRLNDKQWLQYISYFESLNKLESALKEV